ncbi:TrmH family RNA methyltransferase [Paenibacillus sp. MBLB4367]|uniref:TrmH family RNA methyltransferase n=1 Tax=Paenibacillus sp. MBLB4367 TaxID=3384767 RepID=UPI00390818DC
MQILSVQNPKVRQWSLLLTKKGRDTQGKFLVEGTHLVQEALQSGIALEALLYSLEKGLPAELAPLLPDRSVCIGVSEEVLAKCSDTQTPQGVVAVADKPELAPLSLLEHPQPLVVVLDGVQDPGNVGTIVRSADAAGATGIVLGRGTADLYNPKTVRATMGSLFHLPIAEADLDELLPLANAKGVRLVGTSLQAEANCYELDLQAPTWLIVGNEGSGVSPQVERYVTHRTIIPMRGKAESLNVAMATTVLLFEAARQREFQTTIIPVHDPK